MIPRLAALTLLALTLAGCPGPARTQPAAGPRKVVTSAPPPKKSGKELYTSTCSACHGPDGKGVPNIGKDLVGSDFVRAQTDEQLLAFIERGRGVDDPANTTKVAMPPKGGNPSLSRTDLASIVAHLRGLTGVAAKPGP